MRGGIFLNSGTESAAYDMCSSTLQCLAVHTQSTVAMEGIRGNVMVSVSVELRSGQGFWEESAFERE